MEYTAEKLRALGYKGYRHNKMTGHTQEAPEVLEDMAQKAHNAHGKLRFIGDAIGGKVRAYIIGEVWLPSEVEEYAERPMRAAELEKVDEWLGTKEIRITR